jgi:hypothetical protein
VGFSSLELVTVVAHGGRGRQPSRFGAGPQIFDGLLQITTLAYIVLYV